MQRKVRSIIVGAGLGGLACAIACRREGLETIVLERAPKIEPVGAGIQIPPNAARALETFGLLDEIKRKGTVLDSLSLRRYKDGSVLCERPLGSGFHATFGTPWIVIHRHDYHAILLDEATRLGAEIILGQHITKVDVSEDKVITAEGTEWMGDVIIGADGLWSDVRNHILDTAVEPLETGDLAYRGTFSKEQLLSLNDPKVEELCAKNSVTAWLGPDKHSVFYPVRNGQYFNLVLLRPDDLPYGSRTIQGDISEMRATFDGWDPILTKIISCIPSVLKWKLCHFPELQTWAKNHTVLLGDACHPTLPYQAQGAAMAVEDGAVLGHLLGLSTRTYPNDDAVATALRLYEAERKSRTTLNVAGALGNRTFYHLHDGPLQEARDAEMKAFDWENGCSKAWKWLDLDYQKNLLGHDAVKSAEAAFVQMASRNIL